MAAWPSTREQNMLGAGTGVREASSFLGRKKSNERNVGIYLACFFLLLILESGAHGTVLLRSGWIFPIS